MSVAMLVLGEFVMSLSAQSEYETLVRTLQSGWRTLPRVGAKPLQFHHPSSLNTLVLKGAWMYQAGPANSQSIQNLIEKRSPLVLSDSEGNNLGRYVIKVYTATETRPMQDGQPVVTQFSLSLEEYVNHVNPQS